MTATCACLIALASSFPATLASAVCMYLVIVPASTQRDSKRLHLRPCSFEIAFNLLSDSDKLRLLAQ